MTPTLEKAFAEAAKLPQAEQEALAQGILDELAAERRWAEAFAASEDALAQLADEALAEHRAGLTYLSLRSLPRLASPATQRAHLALILIGQ